ncbi:MAG: hypothetical protein ACOX12_01185 [Eggerthellaceae bacterium]|jgi:hypothetical protein
MPEYKIGPLHLDHDIAEVYDGANEYFTRGGRNFNITAKHFDDDDRFFIDFLRSYSFVATEYKATVHLRAKISEEGGTDLFFDIKSQDTENRLKRDITERIATGIENQIITMEGREVPTPEKTEQQKAKEKRNLIIGLVIAIAIVIGAIPVSLNPGMWGF